MPCTSVTEVTRRVPSRSRVSCTMTSTAEASCSRMALVGRSRPAISTMVSMRELQLDGVLDGDDALVVGDERREDVEEGRLAGARATRDDHVQLPPHRRR